MNFDDRAIQRHRLDFESNDLGQLERLENVLERAILGPAVHPRVNRVPVAEPLWHGAPLATILGDVQDGVEDLQVGQTYIATLQWKELLDVFDLLVRKLHVPSVT